MLFSQRKGFKPVRSMVQKDNMDEGLRYGLWDALHLCIWEKINYSGYYKRLRDSNLCLLFQKYWHSLFNYPLDNLPELFDEAHKGIRQYFFECKWFEVYDFIEFTAQSAPEELIDEFEKFCNYMLERELSAYRVVDHKVVEITSDEEISSIEKAIKDTSKLKGVQAHLRAALSHMSDRKNPNFRNSIKESISAVEALSQSITGEKQVTLGAALKVFEERVRMHPALKKSFSALYGYTSDADGIRHAMIDEPGLSFIDAKYMLVACTGFTNYLIGKSAECGIKLQ